MSPLQIIYTKSRLRQSDLINNLIHMIREANIFLDITGRYKYSETQGLDIIYLCCGCNQGEF